MQLSQALAVFEQIAPAEFAESWDNIGLIAGDPAQEVTRALLAIDYTADVAEEGRALGCDLVIAYHPPIFSAIKRLAAGHVVFDAIRRGVAIYSPHTALDVADGGTNDVLCDALGMGERSPLKLSTTPASTRCKIVTFVPADAADKVSDAMCAAGAGRIGNYSSCTFRSVGTGTFIGGDGTNPTVGQAGNFQKAAEIRLELVTPIDRLGTIIAALTRAHPYEEPAFDIVSLIAPPVERGIGRIGTLAAPAQRAELIERLKKNLGLAHVLSAGPTAGAVSKVAVCAGACGELLDDALRQRAEFYVTGEMRHHDAIRAAAAGMTVVCTLHSNSERITLSRLKARLEPLLPGVALHLSEQDRDPFSIR